MIDIHSIVAKITKNEPLTEDEQPLEKAAREIIIRRNFDRQMKNGLSVGGVTLLADDESRGLFGDMASFLALGLVTGQIAPTDTETVYGGDGQPVTAPVSQIAALLFAYGRAYSAAFNAMKEQIAALD